MPLHTVATLQNGFHLRFLITITLNLILASLQMVYAHQAHSISLFSDAIHNLGDVLGLIVAWGAQFISTLLPTQRYTYGYKKATILATFINGVLLFLSGGIIIYESLSKLVHFHPIDGLSVIIIASIGILINSGTALLFLKEKETDLNIKAAFFHLVLDALTSLGVVISALLVYYTHYQWIDITVAFLISFIIFGGSWKLMSRSVHLLLDAVPENIDLHAVTNYLSQIPEVQSVQDLHIRAISTKENALTAHLTLSTDQLETIDLQTIRQELTQKFYIQHCTLQLEKHQEEPSI